MTLAWFPTDGMALIKFDEDVAMPASMIRIHLYGCGFGHDRNHLTATHLSRAQVPVERAKGGLWATQCRALTGAAAV